MPKYGNCSSKLLRNKSIEDERLKSRLGVYDQEKKILARTVKLTEELGELCDEVLTAIGDQRTEKINKRDKNNLPAEFADVIITTLLLAKSMDVDIKEALKNKIERINKRYEKRDF